MRCLTCKHYDADDQVCRRYPPTVNVVLIPRPVSMRGALQGQQQMAMEPTPVGSFPPIGEPELHWCGEWTPEVQS